MKAALHSIAVLVAVMAYSCSVSDVQETELFGLWMQEDSTELRLDSNHRFVASNLSSIRLINPTSFNPWDRFSGCGRWSLGEDSNHNWVELMFDTLNFSYNYQVSHRLYVSRDGMLMTGPLVLYDYDWDNDYSDVYAFRRKE